MIYLLSHVVAENIKKEVLSTKHYSIECDEGTSRKHALVFDNNNNCTICS